MKRHEPGERCLAVREVLNRVGDKWSVLCVALLQQGPQRFSELKRACHEPATSQATLTEGLPGSRPLRP